MAEIVFTVKEVKGEVHLSAIISAEETDSRLVKDTSNIIAPLMLACASAEIAKFFQHLNEAHHG
ncbi:TPA: hypothetical protein ACX3KH_001326 [Raoultella ornithinolytica]|uniref:Uncharacterized protein n=2 Tax=Klebsiella/Raoultella group TaxID=2890311 RepID=A0A378H4J7_KLEPN|nr:MULTISPECIES: hypothetical protein [Klebsiella/Raoultella group]HCT9935500.1 hypothetical protein [Klebsiella variicola]EIV9611407.1 hypothetical protein [Klebsiella pneumoniae]ELI8805898.1 hypothetical protein [Klebsiella michiganensis]ELS4495536.1 hypothetical protein [Klebsiella michiganensis]ELS4628196.1 hypothetical protein [Klebsiella michiganensis]